MSTATHSSAAAERTSKASAKRAPVRGWTPSRALRVQRQCSCGGGGGGCESCRKKSGKESGKEMLQRKAAPAAATRAVPAAQAIKPAASTAAPAPRTALQARPAAGAGVAGTASARPGGAVQAGDAGRRGPERMAGGAAVEKAGAVRPAERALPALAGGKGRAAGAAVGAAVGEPAAAKERAATEQAKVPPVVSRVLEQPGEPLDGATRFAMEGRFGRNFGEVRVHTDALAAESARAVDAQAYTVGQHIVFDTGRYQPGTAEGRKLLAHELTHTIQQHGLQRAGKGLDHPGGESSGEYHQLEREAESVSQAVMRRGVGPAAVSTGSAGRPMVSRVASSEVISCDQDESERVWSDVAGKPNLAAAEVKRYSIPSSEVKADQNNDGKRKGSKVIVAVDMAKPFKLPAEKGNVTDVWKQRMSGCNLEAIIDPGSGDVRTKAGLKQQRPKTEELRNIWLQRVGWSSGYEEKWQQAVAATKAGQSKPAEVKTTSSFAPTVAMGTKCQVDHILELQIGGNNVPENMQMLDGDENEKSGRDIFNDLAAKAVKVRDAMVADVPGTEVQSVLMRFSQIAPADPICGPCCQADAEAAKIKEGGATAGGKGTEYPLLAGGFATKMVAEAGAKSVMLAGSAEARNRSASTLIPGLALNEWKPGKPEATNGGVVEASLDPKGKTSLPASLRGENPISLNRGAADGKLKLAGQRPNVKFHYNYLSEGVFTSFKIEEDGSISGAGTITPSFSFLPKFDVSFDKDKFALSKEIPKEKLKLPVPGLKINEAKIALLLGPEFKPEGHVGFSLEAGQKKLLDGDVTLSADTNGLVAEGAVHAFLPGVDNAEGTISLKNKQWSGQIKIETAQMQSKLKYVKSGSVVVVFNDTGMAAEGTVNLDLPGTQGVEAKLIYESGKKRWIFRGKGSFQIPRLKEAELQIEYDGEHLTGGTGPAGIGFEYHGIQGTLHLLYKDEKFSGRGKLDVKKGKASGTIDVTMHPGVEAPTFSGKGQISYQVNENLVATAGLEIDEKEKVRLTGALEFPKPIPLFKPLEGHYKFFEVGVNIPIPGASVGPVGLNARIDGSMSAGYKLGPGELRNTKMEAAFNPLDEKPDVDVVLTSTLFIGASAYISGRIAGSIVVDAGIASVSGGLAITATASLNGDVQSKAVIHYQQSRIEMNADFEMLVGLAITLALDAFVKAHAGVGPFSVDREKDWNLASYKFDTGMQFGMKLKNPLHYASDQPMKLPAMDDIQWTVPTINPGDLLAKTFGAGSSKEQEKPA